MGAAKPRCALITMKKNYRKVLDFVDFTYKGCPIRIYAEDIYEEGGEATFTATYGGEGIRHGLGFVTLDVAAQRAKNILDADNAWPLKRIKGREVVSDVGAAK
jgi:hypothetical protein